MRVVNGERFVGDEDAGGEAGRKLVEGFEETFLRGKPLNLCDYFPVLRWVDYQGVEKSMRAVQGRRDGFLQGLVDEFRRKREANCVDVGDDYKSSTMIGTLLRLQESEPEFYTEDVIKSVILVSTFCYLHLFLPYERPSPAYTPFLSPKFESKLI